MLMAEAGQSARMCARQGHKIWKEARRTVWLSCGDEADAGWLMESAVEQVSRYLDRKGHAVFSKDFF